MPGYLYPEDEVEVRKAGVKVMGNGTVTAGSKYVNNPDFRVDVIVVKVPKNGAPPNVQKVVAITKQELPQLPNKLVVSKTNHTVLGRRA
jgi:hypothetical protein